MTIKKVKLADIAELAGVSKSTVSFVLNGHAQKHRINEQTVNKVQAIAKANNYSPSSYARALKSKQTYTAGLVIPDLTNMGFATIAKHLETYCRAAGYQLLIASSDDDLETEMAAIQSLIARQVDLLLVASSMTDPSYLEQIGQNTPVILFDRVIKGTTLSSVTTDAAAATQQVVEQLVQGVDECIYIGGQLELSPSIDRFTGYQAGLKGAGLEFKAAHVFSQDYQPQSGYQILAQAFQELARPPQAIFTASYSLLEGVLRYLTEHNMLQADIRLATFDNYDILDCLPFHIHSVEQDCQLIAQTLFETSRALIQAPDRRSETRVLPAKVHFRRRVQSV